jgi:hypothetical protein
MLPLLFPHKSSIQFVLLPFLEDVGVEMKTLVGSRLVLRQSLEVIARNFDFQLLRLLSFRAMLDHIPSRVSSGAPRGSAGEADVALLARGLAPRLHELLGGLAASFGR